MLHNSSQYIIQFKKENPVAAYFIKISHSVSYLIYVGTEKASLSMTEGDLEMLLVKRGAFWIFELHNLRSIGLNEDLERHWIIILLKEQGLFEKNRIFY